MGALKRACLRVTIWIALTGAAHAQTPATNLVVPDISASLGWLNTNYGELRPYDDWSNDGVQGAIAFGWSWTPHVRTEIEASASSRVRHVSSTPVVVNGFPVHAPVEHAFSTRRLTFGVQYQFRENAWFHPQVSAGVDLNWESSQTRNLQPYFYDPSTRQTRGIPPEIHARERTELHTRPFAGAGFKAYMTPRAFFRSDVRVVAGNRIEDVLLRFGFGVDLTWRK